MNAVGMLKYETRVRIRVSDDKFPLKHSGVYETTTAAKSATQSCFCFRALDSKDSLFFIRIYVP